MTCIVRHIVIFHLNHSLTDKKVSKGADKPKPKPVVKQEANEIESENLILVHKKPTHATGRKPLQVADDRKKVEVKTIKTDTKPVRSPQILDEGKMSA